MFKKKKKNDLTATLSQLEEEKSQIEQELEKLKEKLQTEEGNTAELKKKNVQLEEQVQELKTFAEFETERAKELSSELETLESSCKDEKAALEKQVETLQSSGSRLSELEEENESLKLQLSFLETEQGEVGIPNENDDDKEPSKERIKQLESKNEELEKKVSVLEEKLKRNNTSPRPLSPSGESIVTIQSNRVDVLSPSATMGDEVLQLQEDLDQKTRELVEQGEKNFKLYEKLQVYKGEASKAEEEIEKIRGLLINDIIGEETDTKKYKNIPFEELLRLKKKTEMYANKRSGRAATVALEAENLKHSEERKIENETPDDEDSRKDQKIYSQSRFLELEAEIRIVKSNNKQLKDKVKELETYGRNGQAALENMEYLKKKNSELTLRQRNEKDSKKKIGAELEKSTSRVKALSEHIEKLMTHLKIEAAAKLKAMDLQKKTENDNETLKQKVTILVKKNKARERMMLELREGSRILEDQLRLMDEKYVDLRTKLDWTRASSSREVKKIQKEANKLRAKFSLALANGGMNNYLNSVSTDLAQLSSPQSDLGEMSSMLNEPNEVSNQSDEKTLLPSTSSSTMPSTSIISSSLGRNSSAYSSSTGKSSGELPAIESILPAGAPGERYKPRE